jgi:ferredoxin-NADP reductase
MFFLFTVREGIDFSTGLAGYPVTIVEKRSETHDTVTLTLAAHIPLTTTQKPGQYGTFVIDMVTDHTGEEGGENGSVTRSWTISSAPSSPTDYHIAITVKKLEGGKASTWLHNAGIGDSYAPFYCFETIVIQFVLTIFLKLSTG